MSSQRIYQKLYLVSEALVMIIGKVNNGDLISEIDKQIRMTMSMQDKNPGQRNRFLSSLKIAIWSSFNN